MTENMARETGLEPATSGVTGRRSGNEFKPRFDSEPDKTGPNACDSTLGQAGVETPPDGYSPVRTRQRADYSYGGAPVAAEPPITVGDDPLLVLLRGGRR